MRPVDILISGPIGSGKSTLAKALSLKLNHPIYSFATGVREEAIAAGILTRDEAYQKPTPPFVRGVLIATGYGFRKFDPFIWVDRLKKVVRETDSAFIVDDMRYPNEASVSRGWEVIVYLDCEISEVEQRTTELLKVKEMAHVVIPARSMTPEEMASLVIEQMEQVS